MEKNRRLSLPRLILVVLILIGLCFGGFLSWNKFQKPEIDATPRQWFAPYVDVTATPTYAFEQTDMTTGQKNVVLAFVVASKYEPCTPSWGGVYTLDEANSQFDLDRRIARFRQKGGNVAISFGGLLNDELSTSCSDSKKLQAAYQAVIDRYNIDTVDFDLEGKGLTNKEALKKRALVVSKIQQIQKDKKKKLEVWLTLPVAPQGLTEDGTNGVSETLANGVNLAGVNVMTMDYGASKSKNQSMLEASEEALTETHRQLGIIYEQAGFNFDSGSIWAKIGATPMIGQNDVIDEIFTTENATGLNKFAISKGIARVSMWSANRDIKCGENFVDLSIVSDSCSGVNQNKLQFSKTLGNGLTGKIGSIQVVTKSNNTKQKPDDPQKSPYQIWTKNGTYLEGTKVVWHHNVYQAKWWTKGDLPDNPVLQVWQTPWKLIGPVMPGEKPIPQVKLPVGTYPNWSGKEIYEAGQRVLFDGVPYQAKWWTEGESPAASTSSPDSSPWVLLTQARTIR